MEVVSQSSRLFKGKAGQLVVFVLHEQRYALRLSAVEQIIRIVEITPLPKAPEIVLGVVNIHGRITPVYDVRTRFRLPECESSLSDHLIVALTTQRAVALVVDTVTGVITRTDEEITEAQSVSSGFEYVEGVVKLEDGLVFIHDLESFLSAEENIQLDEAMSPGLDLP